MLSKIHWQYSYWYKLGAVCAAAVLLAAGCNKARPAQQNADMVIWQPFAQTRALESIGQAFGQQFRGSRVKIVSKDISTYEQELVNALAAGHGPDIFFINNAWLPQYLDKITPAPQAQWRFVDFKEAFVDVVTMDFTRGTEIYGVPLSVDTLALYYNNALLADSGVYTPPATWGQLQEAARKVRRQTAGGYFAQSGVGLGHSSNASGGQINRAEDILYLLALQLGGSSFSADGLTPTFGANVTRKGKSIVPMVTALDFYTSFAKAESDNYNWNAESDYSIDSFANGRLAMMLNYSYVGDILQQKNAGLRFEVAPAPQDDAAKPAVHLANYWAGVVNKQSKFVDSAWRFLRFATTREQMEKYVAATNLPASRKDLLSVQENDPRLTVFARQTALAKSFFRPISGEMDKIFARAIDNVVFGGINAQQAVTQALRQAQASAQRRN